MEIVFLLIGLFLGAGIIWFLLRFRYETKKASSDEKLKYLEKELE